MLIKYNIENQSIGNMVAELQRAACAAVIDIAQTTYGNVAITHRQRAAYHVLAAITAKSFNSKGYNSGDVETYDNLKNQMFGGVSAMFAGTNFMQYIDSAFDIFVPFVCGVYRRKIIRAIENGRDYIYLIKTDRLRRIFRGLIDSAQSADIGGDNCGVSIDILHDLYAALADYDVYIGDVWNYAERRYNDFDFVTFRDKYSRVYCGTYTRRIRYTENTVVTDSGVYKTDSDGVNRCKCQFKTHDFNACVDCAQSEYDIITHGAPHGMTVALTDTYTINGHWIEVVKYRSVYDMLYAECNAAIEKNRRAYVSGDTYENLTERAERYTDNGLIEIEVDSAKTAIMRALINGGVKRETARKYAAFVSLLDSGYTHENAAESVGLSRMHFNRLSTRYADIIRAALTAAPPKSDSDTHAAANAAEHDTMTIVFNPLTDSERAERAAANAAELTAFRAHAAELAAAQLAAHAAAYKRERTRAKIARMLRIRERRAANITPNYAAV